MHNIQTQQMRTLNWQTRSSTLTRNKRRHPPQHDEYSNLMEFVKVAVTGLCTNVKQPRASMFSDGMPDSALHVTELMANLAQSTARLTLLVGH